MKKAPKVLTRMRLSCCWGDNLNVEELNEIVDYINDLERYCKKQKEENDKLNQKYLNAVADYEQEKFNIEELKKQLEDKENIACNWKDGCLENAGKVEKLENQQKEFINYLENEKDRLARVCNNICEDKFDEVNDILQEYKEIIGDDKE